jgi:hypothetical protein
MKKFVYPCLLIAIIFAVGGLFSCKGTYTDPSYKDSQEAYGGGSGSGTGGTTGQSDADLAGVAPEEAAYLEDPSLASLDTAKRAPYFSRLERYIVLEINRCRADPVAWCKEAGLPMLDGLTVEDEFLNDNAGRGHAKSYPLPALEPRKGLWLAGRFQAHEQERLGTLSHANMNSRFSRYGDWSGSIGECCSPAGIWEQASGPAWYSSGSLGNVRKQAARIVNEFIRDRGVAGKGHRMAIMNGGYRCIGVGASTNGWVTIEFAQGYTDKPEAAATGDWTH